MKPLHDPLAQARARRVQGSQPGLRAGVVDLEQTLGVDDGLALEDGAFVNFNGRAGLGRAFHAEGVVGWAHSSPSAGQVTSGVTTGTRVEAERLKGTLPAVTTAWLVMVLPGGGLAARVEIWISTVLWAGSGVVVCQFNC